MYRSCVRESVCTRSSSKNYVTSTEYVTFILDSCENAVHEIGNRERERERERKGEREREGKGERERRKGREDVSKPRYINGSLVLCDLLLTRG